MVDISMMGFKSLEGATSTIAGIELHHMLKKGQHIIVLMKQFLNHKNYLTCY